MEKVCTIRASGGFADLVLGIQCHAVPFSWKLLFESDHKLFELILCACNAREESQWKAKLLSLSVSRSQVVEDEKDHITERFSILCLDIKPVGRVVGQPGSLVRQLSMQRAATVGSRPNLSQVIIKNTHSLRDTDQTSRNHVKALGRSQSMLSNSSRVPILAPRRAERTRVEQDMAEVWTKESLPYPGMGSQHLDEHIRASASSVLHKLSRASLAASLGKRSASPDRADTESANEIVAPGFGADEAPYGLLPVIESPIGSVKGRYGYQTDEPSWRSGFARLPKRSMSTMSRIKRRVSEAGLGVGTKEDGREDGCSSSQPLQSRWSITKQHLGISL